MPTEPKPTDQAADTSMNWVMVLWLCAFLACAIFGIGAYLYNWFADK